jgi:hypothetical protein
MIILCAISVAVAIVLRVIEEMFIDPNKPVPSLLRKIFFLRENKNKGKQSCHNNSFCIDIENKGISTITEANGAVQNFSYQKNKVS